jgi:hypothetical protein
VGARVVLAKTAGWAGGFGFFMLLAWAMIRGGLTQALAFVLLALCLGGFLRTALRYVCYAGMLRRLTQQLACHLATAGCDDPARLAGRIVSELGGDPSRTESLLSQVGVPATRQAACVQFVRDELQPAIRKPVADLDRGFFACYPWFSAAGRSFTLAFFVLVWFMVVPMPGLLAFQAPGGYRFSLPLASLLYSLAGLLAVVLAARLLSRALDWWQARGSNRASVFAGATRAWQEFQSQQGPGNRLAPHEVSGVYGLFTDLQTYVEQRSTAFARRTLASINRVLAAAAAKRNDSSNS